MDMNLREKIREIQDFPKEGISFKDITTILADPQAFQYAIDKIVEALKDVEFDVIVAPEARGFIMGTPVAYVMNKAFVPVRKKGKLPYKTVSYTYDLEYNTDTIEMHEDALKKGQKVVVIDDLLATGGTVKAITSLCEREGAEVVKLVFLIELLNLDGREELSKYNMETIVKFEE